jgi:hypothetical protein
MQGSSADSETEHFEGVFGLVAGEDGQRMVFVASGALVTLRDRQNKDGTLSDLLLIEGKEQQLREFILDLANHFARYLRAFAGAVGIKEIPRDVLERADFLKQFSVHAKVDEEWRALDSSGILPFFGQTAPTLGFRRSTIDEFSRVAEALEHRIEPQIEQELVVNAIDHLRARNYRYAVLESVIALEILLTPFLRDWLRIEHGCPPQDIDNFLTKDLALGMKLAALIRLAIPSNQLENIDLEKIRSCVGWRNKLVHNAGKLPDGVPGEVFAEGVFATLGLVGLLEHSLFRRRRTEDFRPLRTALQEVFATKVVSTDGARDHYLWIVIQDATSKDIAASAYYEEQLKVAVPIVAEHVEAVDPLFKPERHLFLRIKRRDKVVGSYIQGNVTVMTDDKIQELVGTFSLADIGERFRLQGNPER